MSATKVSAKAMRRLAVASALVVLGISLAATRGVGMRNLVLLHQIPGGDLLGHFFPFGTVSLSFRLGLHRVCEVVAAATVASRGLPADALDHR